MPIRLEEPTYSLLQDLLMQFHHLSGEVSFSLERLPITRKRFWFSGMGRCDSLWALDGNPMSSPLSFDLRECVVHDIEDDVSRCQAVTLLSAQRFEQEGCVEVKSLCGGQRSQHAEAHSAVMLGCHEEQQAILLLVLCSLLTERGATTSESDLSRFFKRHGFGRKKGQATEQDRFDVRAERENWFEVQDELDPDNPVFIDEIAPTTAMERCYGR